MYACYYYFFLCSLSVWTYILDINMTIFNISFWICSHFCIALTVSWVKILLTHPPDHAKHSGKMLLVQLSYEKWMWHLMNHLMNLTLVTLVCVYMNCHTESTVCVCVCVCMGENCHFFKTLFHKQPFLCVFISARAQVSDTRRSPSLRLYKQKD